MTPTELVTKLLAEGAKEFPHQWEPDSYSRGRDMFCKICSISNDDAEASSQCVILLTIALDLTRQQLAEALDPTVKE